MYNTCHRLQCLVYDVAYVPGGQVGVGEALCLSRDVYLTPTLGLFWTYLGPL